MDFKNEKFDIIIQAGQSNAEGCGRGPVTEEYIPDDDICYLIRPFTLFETIVDKGEWKLLLEWGDKPPEIDIADERVDENGKRGDFSLSFAKLYKSKGYLNEGRKLLIIRAGVGGTGFMKKYWTMDGKCYRNMIELIDLALSLNKENRIVGMLWHQGEHDAFEGNTRETFENQLTACFNSVKERYSLSDLPIIAADFVNDWKSKNIESCEPIVSAIRRVVDNFGGAFIETADLLSNSQANGGDDDIHFCREALNELGRRYFQAYERLVKKN